jgi:hypothetical protein
MASGCIPKKANRRKALTHARGLVRKSLALLNKIDDPDKSSREVEHAASLLYEALGQRADAFIDRTVHEGLSDLTEHYFS